MNKKKRGRPPGRSAKGEQTREDLYRTALALFAERGFEGTTMRAIAESAGVSPGLTYRYFPSKRSVVLALYEDLSVTYAQRMRFSGATSWSARFVHALRQSLDVLGPHRDVLAALTPLIVSGGEEGIFAPNTLESRERVMEAFVEAIELAEDGPPGQTGEQLGRLLYLAHLAVILWWLLDRSEGQQATTQLVNALEEWLAVVAPLSSQPVFVEFVSRASRLVGAAFGLPRAPLVD